MSINWLYEKHEIEKEYEDETGKFVDVRFEDGTGATYTKEEYEKHLTLLKQTL
jgi:hypothetical protein